MATAFFDVRITHVNSLSNTNRNTDDIFKQHEGAKKREYLQRVLEVEHATFTPLVMGTNGGMGKESDRFIRQLSEKLAKKQNESYSTVISWLRTKLSFCIIRSALMSIRGSRTPWRAKHQNELGDDCILDNVQADIIN